MTLLKKTLVPAFALGLVASTMAGGQGEEEPSPHAREMTPVKISLLEPGESPRKALRYEPAAGDSQTILIEVSSSMAQMGQEMLFPTIAITTTITVDEVTDGLISATVHIDDAKVVDKEGAHPMIAAQMKGSVPKTIGKEAKLVTSDRGITKECAFDPKDKADNMVRSTLETVENLIGVLLTPLPEEKIGQGAQWTTSTTIERGGITVDQVATYSLKGLESNTMELEILVEHSAKEQTIKQQGMEITLETLKSKGKGVGTIPLAELAPVEARMSTSMETVMSFGQGAGGQQITQSVKSRSSITREE